MYGPYPESDRDPSPPEQGHVPGPSLPGEVERVYVGPLQAAGAEGRRSTSERTAADWTSLVTGVALLAKQDDATALTMGDCLARIAQAFGREGLQRAAEQAGITWSCAYGRYRVSRRFPPAHPVRRYPLSFSHLRALMEAPEPLGWATRATEHQWSVSRLRGELAREGDRIAVRQGEPCPSCTEPVGTGLLRLQLSGERAVRLCSVRCGIAYLRSRLRPRDPFT